MVPSQGLQVQLTHCQASETAAALGTLSGRGNRHVPTPNRIWGVSAMLSSSRLRNGFLAIVWSRFPHFAPPCPFSNAQGRVAAPASHA